MSVAREKKPKDPTVVESSRTTLLGNAHRHNSERLMAEAMAQSGYTARSKCHQNPQNHINLAARTPALMPMPLLLKFQGQRDQGRDVCGSKSQRGIPNRLSTMMTSVAPALCAFFAFRGSVFTEKRVAEEREKEK